MNSLPWYKQFWPWMIIAIPLSSVIMGIIIILVAFNEPDSLVRSDFYKEGKIINRKLQLEKQALLKNISADLQLDILSWDISVNVKSAEKLPKDILLEFIHPTRSQQDKQLTLHREQLHTEQLHNYSARLPTLIEGRWYVQISDHNNSWRVKGELQLNQKNDNGLYTVKLDAALSNI